LLLDGKFIQKDLVEALVKVVQVLEFVVSIITQSVDSLDLLFMLDDHTVNLFVERKYFFFLSLKLATKFSGLKDLLTKLSVTGQSFHAVKRAQGDLTKVLLLGLPLLGHLGFQIVVVRANAHLFFQQLVVSNCGFNFCLRLLLLPVFDLLLEPVNLLSQLLDIGGVLFVCGQKLFVLSDSAVCVRSVTVELDLKFRVKSFDLLDQFVLHRLKFFDILVLGLLTGSLETVLHCFELSILLLLDGFNHFSELKSFHFMTPLDIRFLTVKLLLNNPHIALKFFM